MAIVRLADCADRSTNSRVLSCIMESKELDTELALVEYLGTEAYVATILFLSYRSAGKV